MALHLQHCRYNVQKKRGEKFIVLKRHLQEFLTGARLEVEELGPYTWQESWHRAGVEWGPEGNTVSSRLVKSYVWREDLSRGSRADLLTLPNVPMFVSKPYVHCTLVFCPGRWTSLLT